MGTGVTRSQERYDAFATTVDTPMLVLTTLWLPVLIVPLASTVHGTVATTFTTIDYTVWALFSLEYIVKFWLAPDRGRYFKTHLLDLLIVAVPFFRPLRMGRLIRLLRLALCGRRPGREPPQGSFHPHAQRIPLCCSGRWSSRLCMRWTGDLRRTKRTRHKYS